MPEIVEHHNPLGGKGYISSQHVERYRFALSRLRPGMKVLDMACGAGYGTMMLASRGVRAVGADYDERAVRTARALWGKPVFIRADALDLPFRDGAFDAVVSFETVEHTTEGERFLAEIHRALRPGGTLILSTPNIKYTAHPPYHLKEYEPDEFFELAGSMFTSVERHAQYFRRRDRLADLAIRRVLGPLASAIRRGLGKIGLEDAALRAIQRGHGEGGVSGALMKEALAEAIEGEPDSVYRVKPLGGHRLLRIMIAVAEKARTR
ncbi:MAG: class I SAM-dependent methyltransferase [Candidatus Nitrospinota bacterium M3_3B_026]